MSTGKRGVVPPMEDRVVISTHFMSSTHGEDVYEAIRLVHEGGVSGVETARRRHGGG
jgi:hypothetical protein